MFETVIQRALLRGRSEAVIVRPRSATPPRPAVTVVVPCYNYGRYLEGAVASALSQPDVDVRVVIVDDSSTDDSAAVARRIAERDDRVSVIVHETNRGHIATYNEGLGAVTTEFVVLLSADDLLTPGALGRATALMRAFPNVGFTYGLPVIFRGGELPPARTRARTWTVWKGSDWIADRCRLGRNAIYSPEVVLRTSVLHAVGMFDAAQPHSGDLDLWLRMAQLSDVGLISGADQGYYREHPSSMSRTTFAGLLTDMTHRRRTFRSAVAPLDNGDELFEQAARALSREALRVAAEAHDQPGQGSQAADDFVAFARDTWPTADGFPEAEVARILQGPANRTPAAVMSGSLRRGKAAARARIRDWRRQVTGV